MANGSYGKCAGCGAMVIWVKTQAGKNSTNGKAKAIKVDTLNKICRALDCQPGDILEYVPSDDEI